MTRTSPGYRAVLAGGAFFIILASASGGCAADAPMRERTSSEVDSPGRLDELLNGAALLVAPSKVDTHHLYKPTVDDQLHKLFTPKEKIKVQGGLVADQNPRDVVIAKAKALRGAAPLGHIYDAGSECLASVSVETVSYKLRGEGKGRQTINDDCWGRVWVHPDFEMLMDVNKNLVWGSADLALILLNQPFELSPMKLARGEVRPGDSITIVGLGRGESQQIYGDRQFGGNTVAGLMRLETGSTIIAITGQTLPDGGPASHAYGGDSGGACISTSDVPALAGIVSMGSRNKRGEPVSLCMSIDSHRAWLDRIKKELASQPTMACEEH